MTRFRDLGLRSGQLPTGNYNAITDVAGVKVGHTTLIRGDDIRTGVTAILPHEGNLFTDPVTAAVHTINGFGKAAGFEQVRELGTIETPILLTSTLNVGKARDALVSYMLQQNPTLKSVNPLVGECNDSVINNGQIRAVGEAEVFAAIESAQGGAVLEGCVGAGTGTTCYEFKGGIGTASRVTPHGYTVGALLQTNFGARHELQILGVPLGQHLPRIRNDEATTDGGSVMIILATDAPLTSRQLTRLTHRAAFGLARTGTVCHHGSGDFVIAFTTQHDQRLRDDSTLLNPLFQAVVESVEEAVYNALIAAVTLSGRNGNTLHALDHADLLHWLEYYHRR